MSDIEKAISTVVLLLNHTEESGIDLSESAEYIIETIKQLQKDKAENERLKLTNSELRKDFTALESFHEDAGRFD